MLDVVIVGAGHAGLAASYCLKETGLSHVVLERGRVGESWRSQRWDSFVLNTPNWCSHLPGDEYDGDNPDAFYDRDTFVSSLEAYRARFGLPVETGVEVVKVTPEENAFLVSTRSGSDALETIRASNVIVASGLQNVPKTPKLAETIAPTITQLHAANYRNPSQLSGGAVLVVGSGQSGFQIAEDLLEAGRRVYFSTSKVARMPRRYRGRDILEWWKTFGVFELRTSELKDPSVRFETVAHISGVGKRGHTVSHQHLARAGAVVVGRLEGFMDGSFAFAGDAAENVRYSDAKSAWIKKSIDDFLTRSGLPLPPHEDDPNDEPDPGAACASPMRSLNVAKSDVRTVIWCTGFSGSFDWIDAPVCDDDGQPLHRDGVSPCDGLFFLGFPWLRKRKSGIIAGIADDARFVVSRIISRQRP